MKTSRIAIAVAMPGIVYDQMIKDALAVKAIRHPIEIHEHPVLKQESAALLLMSLYSALVDPDYCEYIRNVIQTAAQNDADAERTQLAELAETDPMFEFHKKAEAMYRAEALHLAKAAEVMENTPPWGNGVGLRRATIEALGKAEALPWRVARSVECLDALAKMGVWIQKTGSTYAARDRYVEVMDALAIGDDVPELVIDEVDIEPIISAKNFSYDDIIAKSKEFDKSDNKIIDITNDDVCQGKGDSDDESDDT